MTRNYIRTTSGLAIAVCSLACASPAFAQDTAASQAEAVVPDDSLGEIVVTAQRREQRADDVGVTINVLTGSDLKAAGTQSIVDLAAITPNVQIKNVLANSVVNVSIRGIGLNDYAANNNPAAGMYVDNVYLVSPAMLSFGLFDIDRVEILKGPQGDLYGRNTTAGAVNIISRKPSDITDVQIEAGYGTYDSWHIDGAVGGALTSTLTARFALQTVQQGSGPQTNYVTGNRIGKVDRTNGRLQLQWEPSDSFNLLLNAHKGYDRSDVTLYKADNILTTEEDAFASQPRVSGAGIDPYMRLESSGISLTGNWSISPQVTLTSISAYEHFTRLHVEDTDGTSVRYLDATYDNSIDQYSQELRLAYHGDGLELIGGAFYSHDKVNTRDAFYSPDLLPLFGLAGLDTIGNTYRQRTDAYAAFMHAEWTFAPNLTLVGGLRYTEEEKTFDQATTFLCAAGTCSNLFAPVTNNYSTSNVSGKIGVNYQAGDRTLVYASISRGFKSGGFQGQLTFDPTVLQPFGDEKLTAYELGIKTRLFSNFQLNAAVFDYEYSDAQIYGPLFDSPVGVLFGIANVGDARVKGIEADARWRPAEGLDVRFGVGMIDTEVTKSVVAGVTQGSVLPNSPRLTLNGRMKYEWSLSDRAIADITLSGNYQSRVRFDIVRSPAEAVEGGYFLGNAEIGVSLADHWRASVWVKNVFDHLYRTQALNTSVGWTSQYGAPRTAGANISYKF
ncbi:MAG: iron complex outermembrane receptor protein [Parasphingorhabdus sp.]|jgi:iron complex outermembrane receptor protein|uniref:TonB-dependent receptor n=1 Tax=Parasphingorhabdus sp. TaxID=2709688 RepID=UPI0039E25204